ncbi:MAG: flagellar biosynthesis protein FlhA [Armatimonadetes bacterium]|nr:MAG: flagellar biosynthesis protein FlhA [Armatimonadota bacterium]
MNRILKQKDTILAIGILTIVVMLILPLPTWALDALLIVSLGVSVGIALMATSVSHPLEFDTFPSILLITTLLRLALSVAATKLILGAADAGHVIETFGQFVMGGDFVVGLVVFAILIIVQFVVITNGAGRVAEVVARFTLDAMPGKQMAIDADLNAGLITEEEAKERRALIKREADFYGAMDGASKFIKGDAIASILIILVNIIGGVIVGLLRGQGAILDILQTYAVLSVGEGLVSQIPALLISTSAGLLVTRSSQEGGMGTAVFTQVGRQPKAIQGVGMALIALGFVPGFPKLLFFGLGALAILAARSLSESGEAAKKKPDAEQASEKAGKAEAAPTGPEAVLGLLNVDAIELEIGYGLTKLADPRQGGDLADRIAAIRRQLATELGFVLPRVRIRDDANLGANDYVIRIRGEEVARATAFPNNLLAIDGGGASAPIAGTQTKDPVFGIDAVWIEREQRDQAERNGYTVVDPSTMISTHLSELVKQHAAELLTRQDVQLLLDHLKEEYPAIVEDLVPAKMSVGEVQKALQHLLREGIPVRDLVTILETLADYSETASSPEQLGELVRAAIPRTITRRHLSDDGVLHCFTLEPSLEGSLSQSLTQTPYGNALALEPGVSRELVQAIQREADRISAAGHTPVLLCGTTIRLPLKRLLERNGCRIAVMAFNEVSANAEVQFDARVSLPVATAA